MTLLVVLGTSLITQLAGLSLALGAFLVGRPGKHGGWFRAVLAVLGGCPRVWWGDVHVALL